MHTLIFDIGKTNIKCLVFNEQGLVIWSCTTANKSIKSPLYLHIDVDSLWQWLLDVLREVATRYEIVAINVSTHGASAVILNESGELALPVLDYESTEVQACSELYHAVRPGYRETYSPHLPVGLNLGKQLFWLRQQFPDAFLNAHTLLMYPQYWVWKLSGKCVTERSSLGCHTDLWNPVADCYSSLVNKLGIGLLFPAITNASDVVGTITADVAAITGLSKHCRVYAGVHDSNASFARYLACDMSQPLTVVSTGTWIITMTAGVSVEVLDESRDTLANVNVLGQPLACARFMGGREFTQICTLTQAGTDDDITEQDIAQLISDGVFALPGLGGSSGPFTKNSGPFGKQTFRKHQGEIIGAPHSGKALATLYLALMIDYELDLLGITGDVVFGSSSKKNSLICRLIAQLRKHQRIQMSGDEGSTALGAWCLTRWHEPLPVALNAFSTAQPADIDSLSVYRDRWRQLAENN